MIAAFSRIATRARSLWRGIRGDTALDADMAEEFRTHLELRAADLVRRGLSAGEAARQARLEFGSPGHYRDEGRESRGLKRVDDLRVSWLDFKLGVRMLVKYPVLTLVGGLAMAFAIAVGAATFEFVRQTVYPVIPLPDGRRLVGIQYWYAVESRAEYLSLSEHRLWKRQLTTVEDLGAFRTVTRNLIGADGRGDPIEVAAITASSFKLTRTAPLLGRTLIDSDEQPGAPAVIIIGFDVWRSRFASDPAVVGRTIRLESSKVTIVGVMPKGFGFPVAHSYWVPLTAVVGTSPAGGETPVNVFGRLASGVSRSGAQAEADNLAARAEADIGAVRHQRRAQVLSYAESVMPLPDLGPVGLMAVNVFFVMLLVLVCANVALLMFARAATREAEIAVRSALGASRGRIVGQLFAEALVLGIAATVVGLAAARFALRWWLSVSAADLGPPPFWFNDRLSPATLAYAGVLTVLGAAIAGVMPALKVTGSNVETRLRQLAAGGGGLRFGGVWTAVIVSQVAVTVAFPATAFFAARYVSQVRGVEAGFAAAEYLSVRLEMNDAVQTDGLSDTTGAANAARERSAYEELERRLTLEPNVRGVAFADRLPRTNHPAGRVEVDSSPRGFVGNSAADVRVSSARVSPNYFAVLGAPVLAGRGFHAGDVRENGGPAGGVVIVNQSFVKRVLMGRNAVGRRVRYAASESTDGRPGPWFEIVGVVKDLGMISDDPKNAAGLYHPAATGRAQPTHMVVHVAGDPESFASRLRSLATAVDPGLKLYNIASLNAVSGGLWRETQFLSQLLTLVSVIALGLSLTAIYAVMSFAVSRRTREIGIRVALGSDARRVIVAIFTRPLTQVGGGVVAGGALVTLLVVGANAGAISIAEVAALVGYALLMMAVCMLACIAPTRRALAVQPTDALRADR